MTLDVVVVDNEYCVARQGCFDLNAYVAPTFTLSYAQVNFIIPRGFGSLAARSLTHIETVRACPPNYMRYRACTPMAQLAICVDWRDHSEALVVGRTVDLLPQYQPKPPLRVGLVVNNGNDALLGGEIAGQLGQIAWTVGSHYVDPSTLAEVDFVVGVNVKVSDWPSRIGAIEVSPC